MTIALALVLIGALVLWTHSFRQRMARRDAVAAELAEHLEDEFELDPEIAAAVVELARYGNVPPLDVDE